MPIPPIDNFNQGGPIIPKGSHLEQLVRGIRQLDSYVASLAAEFENGQRERFLAFIANKGPNDEKDFPNDSTLYWVTRQALQGSAFNEKLKPTDDTSEHDAVKAIMPSLTPPIAYTYPASNWNQLGTPFTKRLPTTIGLPVEVFSWWDGGNPNAVKHYLFCYPFPEIVTVYVTDIYASSGPTGSGGGRYKATIVRGFEDGNNPPSVTNAPGIDPTTNLNIADGMQGETVPGLPTPTQDCVFENVWESGTDGSHFLELKNFYCGYFVGYTNSTPPLPVFRENVTPDTITIKLDTAQTKGAGIYTGKILHGFSNTVDTSMALDFPETGNTQSTDTVIWENIAEYGNTVGHALLDAFGYGATNTIYVQGFPSGMTNDTPPVMMFRGSRAWGQTSTLKITSIPGSTSSAAGSGRYNAVVVTGQAANVNASGTQLTLPDVGETTSTNQAWFENSYENNLSSANGPPGIWLLYANGTEFVEAVFKGLDNGNPAIPIFRAWVVPRTNGACDLARNTGGNATNSGTGTPWVAATYTYDLSINGRVIATNLGPHSQRPGGFLTGPATAGTYFINQANHIILQTTDEQLAVKGPC